MYESEKLEIIAVANEIKRGGVVQRTGGYVSVR